MHGTVQMTIVKTVVETPESDALRVLREAGEQFKSYAEQHRAKGTPEAGEKAKVNEEWAARCFAACETAADTFQPYNGMVGLMDDVAAFHLACDVPISDVPCIPAPKRKELRVGLIREEWKETHRAMMADDLPEIADGFADMIYVIIGAALEYGIPLAAVWQAVQNANMAKVDPATGRVRKREDGKVLKPPGWTPPDIGSIIEQAMARPVAPTSK